MTKFILVTFILFSFISLADINSAHIPSAQSIAASAQPTDTNNADLELAQRYVPVLYFHPDEIYYPQPVDVVLGISRLRQSRLMWFDTTILNHSTMQDLFTKPSDETWFLDQWLGDTGSSEYANYSTHSLHNLLANSLVELNVFTVIVTSAGTLVLWAVAGWSLLKQRRLLRKELHGLFMIHFTILYRIRWCEQRPNGMLCNGKDSAPGSRYGGSRAYVLSWQMLDCRRACSPKIIISQIKPLLCRLRSIPF